MHAHFHMMPLGTTRLYATYATKPIILFIGSKQMPRHKLTDAFLRSVKPPTNGQTEYWDTLTPGFGVRVSYGGRKAFGVLTRSTANSTASRWAHTRRCLCRKPAIKRRRLIKDAAKGISPKEREAEERRKVQADRRHMFAYGGCGVHGGPRQEPPNQG